MNNIEKYIDFLDNKLESNEEQQFAENLAIDSDFRNDFKKYLVLTNALSASSDYYVPSMDSKKAVFSSLGFSIGASDSPEVNKKTSFFKGRIFTMLATAITTFAITAMMFRFYDADQSAGRIDSKSLESSSGKTNQNELIKPPVYDTDLYKKHLVHKPKSTLLAVNNSEKQKKEPIPPDNINSERIELSPANFQNENMLALAQKKDKSDLNKFIYTEENQLSDTIFLIRSYDSKIRFEFKNTPSWYSQSPSLQPSRQNNFNNLSVSLYYPVYKTLLLGADFRQETFYVEYDGQDSKGMDSKFYQYPNLSTYGLSLRYSPFNIGNEIKPFAQLFMGGNSVGIISREMFGIEYYPFENVYFLFGGELNQFYFAHNNTWFNSNKYSFNYGIGVKF